MLSLINNHLTVDHDNLNPNRILVGILKIGSIDDGRRIKDDQISHVTLSDPAPIGHAQPAGDLAAHFVDRFLQAKNGLIAGIATQNANVRAV